MKNSDSDDTILLLPIKIAAPRAEVKQKRVKKRWGNNKKLGANRRQSCQTAFVLKEYFSNSSQEGDWKRQSNCSEVRPNTRLMKLLDTVGVAMNDSITKKRRASKKKARD